MLAGVFGASVGFEMVAAGEHYASDVVVGFVIGAAVGFLIPWLHSRQRESNGKLSLVGNGEGLEIVWRKYF